MIHLVLWLNILSLLVFMTAFPVLAALWIRGLYSWTRVTLWSLSILVVYQLLFTFRFFLTRYVPELTPLVIMILELTSATASIFSLYLLPLMTARYTGRILKKRHYLTAAIAPMLLLISLFPILYLRDPLIARLINSGFYLYIGAVSFYGYAKSAGIHLAPEAQAVRYFFLINIFFYLIMLFYLNVFPFTVPPDIPGVIFLVPVYILAWAGTLIIASARSLVHRERTATALPAAFIDRYQISPREAEVLQLLIQGRSNKEIGETLFISARTVETHLHNMYGKCGVKSRLELIKRAGGF